MMPLGLGVDIIEIDRIRKACDQNPRILNRLFTAAEQEDYMRRGGRMETLAGKFAAKEAVVKALGTGFRGISWVDVEILPDEMGKPVCHLHRYAHDAAESKHIREIIISIAHNRTMAIANALAVQKEICHETGDQ